jgi:hypothetical protein
MVATVQGAYFFRNRVRSIPMYIGMSNDFYRPTKIASCAPGFFTSAMPVMENAVKISSTNFRVTSVLRKTSLG